MEDLRDRYRGCLIGLAVGDALGFATEFLRAPAIRARYGPAGVTDFEPAGGHPRGTFTDDTQMTLALAEALLEAVGDAELDLLMGAVGRRFVAWSRSPENNRAPGNTCLAACRALAGGADWRASGVAHSKGCGAPMRTAPVGLRYHRDQARIATIGAAAARITHGHPTAVAASVAMSLGVSLALDGTAPEAVHAAMVEAAAALDRPCADHLALVPSVLGHEPEAAFGLLGEGWVAEEAVAAALYCWLRAPDDYARCVLAGANASGDSDSIACLAGALCGASLGLEAVPSRWRAGVEQVDRLLDTADRLHAAWLDSAP